MIFEGKNILYIIFFLQMFMSENKVYLQFWTLSKVYAANIMMYR